MRRERFFCAAESRAHSEAIFGTVAHVRSWLLIEYPSAWRRDAIEDSRLLPPQAKAHVRQIVDRPLLIRRDHCPLEHIRCFFVQSTDPATMTAVSLRSYDDLADFHPTAHKPPAVGPDILYAICTHGRHDRCCAKFGIPLSCAFRDAVGERAWQCSHVGGDRFAGNVVVFPYGIYYGRATPDDVPEIIRRTEAGEIWLPGYRGRSCYPKQAQVADYFARRESGRLAIGEFHPLDRTRLDSGAIRIRLQARSDSTIHTVEFATRADAYHQRLTCDAHEESPVPQYDLRRYSVEL
jgi:hypothetical protein